MKFDRTRAGTVCPPMEVAGHAVPACYELDGHLFDAHGRWLDPSAPAKPATVAVVSEKPAETEDTKADEAISVDALIAQAGKMPYAKLAKHAKAVLGPECPSGKAAIIAALEAARAAYVARKAAREEASPAKVVPPPADSPSAPATPVTAGGIDLAAWGRGQRDYLFGDVRKAVQGAYHKIVTERRDAVEFLIDQGLIRADQARQDV